MLIERTMIMIKKAKVIFAIMVVVLYASAMQAQISATTTYVENGFTFELNDADSTAIITDYDGVVKDVQIPETVQFNDTTYIVNAIGDNSFGNKKLTSVTFTNNITTIGTSAFSANYIKTVYLPDSVVSIGEYSFGGNEISSLRISNRMTVLPRHAFGSNFSLKKVEIPSNIIRIESSAFLLCQISDLVIPDSVTYIGDYAFYQNKLISLKLSNNLETIGDSAFSSSTHSLYNQLTSVVIPDSVKTIGYQAFMFNRINTIVMSGNITSIGYQAFFEYPDVNSMTMFINDVANTDRVIEQLNSSALSAAPRNISLFAYNHIVGNYVEGTQNAYVLGVGQTQELTVSEFFYPQVKKSSYAVWGDPDEIMMPVTAPIVEWHKVTKTGEDSIVGSGISFLVSEPGEYYATVNGVKQLSKIKIERASYSMRFDLNMPERMEHQTKLVEEGTLITPIDNPTWENHTFIGWNTNMDGTGLSWDFAVNTMPGKDITLYAQWKENELLPIGHPSKVPPTDLGHPSKALPVLTATDTTIQTGDTTNSELLALIAMVSAGFIFVIKKKGKALK